MTQTPARPVAGLKPATSDTVYEPVPGWARVPHGIWLREATSVAVDSEDNVYVFNRGNMPMVVFDPEGEMVDMWGNNDPFGEVGIRFDSYGNRVQGWAGSRFSRPHSIHIDREDRLWLVDDTGNRIYRTDKRGRNQMTIGTGAPAPRQSGEMFNRPTDVTVSPSTGEIFVSDGYGNSRVHRLDADGRHIMSWGEPGTDPGQFNLPHNIALVGEDRVIVCDRENNRVQMFTIDGEFIRQWMVHKAVAVFAGRGDDTNLYIAEQGPAAVQRGVANIGNRVGIYTRDGDLIQRIGAPHFGQEPDQFLWPHSVAVDSRGDIYIAEVSFVEWGRHQDPPVDNPASLRKWRRISG
jgi:DNA-binding beta-propeller fold protein YncE